MGKSFVCIPLNVFKFHFFRKRILCVLCLIFHHTLEALIGVVCGSVAAVLLIIGITIFMFRRKSKEILSNSSDNRDSSSDSREKQAEYIDQELHEHAVNENDKWL